MKLYKISAPERECEQFTSAVVVAENEQQARYFHPNGECVIGKADDVHLDWCDPAHVQIIYLGEASPALPLGVICADYLSCG